MYLELSGRQTNKSSRLIREIDYWLAIPTNHAVLITHNLNWANELVRMLNPRNTSRLTIGVDFQATVRKLRGTIHPEDRTVKLFWDEFDLCNIENVPIYRNGYYVTTSKFTRHFDDWENWQNDVLLRLIVANDFTYVVHHGMQMFFDSTTNIDDVRRSMTVDQFNNQFMCTFNTSKSHDKPRRNPFQRKHLDLGTCGTHFRRTV